ncbi:hypothetical protein CKO28_13710 [Rhodovibrio sodomensis]|uniref:MFS transporter n=1 Tax=Rhodovibrio sodomensis TaxID=1088 RepID=A0ABS1DF49_9PROT|nr:hypothetical protein [Rhodovibrio sodomensis]MBK1669090.1 hypothetical protein [Rhodovibrio sodomensis]
MPSPVFFARSAAGTFLIPGVLAHLLRLIALELVTIFGIAVMALSGHADQRLLLAFVAAYLLSAALNFARGRGLIASQAERAVLRVLALAFLLGALGLAAWSHATSLVALPFTLAIVGGFVVREAGFLDALHALHGASTDSRGRTAAISLLTGLQPLILGVSVMLAGMLAHWQPEVPFLVAALGASTILFCSGQSARDPGPASADRPWQAVPAPVWLLCATSTLYNAASLLKSRILVPVYVVATTQALGLSEHVFSVLGVATGLVATLVILGRLARQRIDRVDTAPRRMIQFGLISTSLLVLLWGVLDIWLLSPDRPWVVALIALTIVLQTLTTQFWNAGFFAELRRQAALAGPEAEAPERTRAFASLWQTGKNLGAPVGFTAAAVFTTDLTQSAGVAVLLVGAACLATGLGYALLAHRLDPRAAGASAR